MSNKEGNKDFNLLELLKEKDTRPPKGWYAPGEYIVRCRNCNHYFVGDKRAGHCGDCEYKNDFQDFQI